MCLVIFLNFVAIFNRNLLWSPRNFLILIPFDRVTIHCLVYGHVHLLDEDAVSWHSVALIYFDDISDY